jgi:hypothetical protein
MNVVFKVYTHSNISSRSKQPNEKPAVIYNIIMLGVLLIDTFETFLLPI